MKKQNYGFRVGMIVLFLGLTIYYLFPTLQWSLEQRHMESMTEAERVHTKMKTGPKIRGYKPMHSPWVSIYVEACMSLWRWVHRNWFAIWLVSSLMITLRR